MTEHSPSDANGLPKHLKITTDGTGDKATQINLGSVGKAKTVSVYFKTSDGKVAFETSADTIHASHLECDADSLYQWTLSDVRRSGAMYVASATSSVTCTIVFE